MKTIKDIAKELEIAPSTVSRVLNNSGYYSKEVGEKVRKYVEETGFVYNQSAKRLRSKKSNTIGLILPDISNDFFSKIALIVDEFFSKRGYSLYICNTASYPKREFNSFKQLAANQVDGIICIGSGIGLNQDFTKWNIPIVVLDRPFNPDIPVTHIYSNEYELGQLAAQKLLDAGCKKIKLTSRALQYQYIFSHPRFKGFLDKMNIHTYQELLPVYIPVPFKDGYEVNEAEKTFNQYLENKLDFDGLFCLSDNIAYGVIKAFNKANISVPEDVKIIGFDNNIYASLSIPSITTIDRNLDLMAKTACEKLLEKIESEEKFTKETIIIVGSLIERESC